jgi:hypothetical protein
LKEIEKWEIEYIKKKENSLLSKAGDLVFNPVKRFSDDLIPKRIKKVSTRVSLAVETAVCGCMDAGQDIVNFTYDKDKAVKKFKNKGVNTLDDLYKIDVTKLDKIARKIVLENKVIGLVEGFAFGLGNITAAIADIPIFFTLTFRVMQQIASIYGYDPEDPKEKLYMIKLMSYGTAARGGSKLGVQAELQTLKVGIKRYTFKKMQKMGGKYSFVITARSVGKNVGVKLTKKTLLKGIPVIGGLFGGLFNYGFIKQMADVSNMMYKKRFLEDKLEKRDNKTDKIIDI